MPRGYSGLVALVEHVWARQLHEATRYAGRLMLGQAMIEPEGLILLGMELEAAIEDATRVVVAALAIEKSAEQD